jgi:hypothetical protein
MATRSREYQIRVSTVLVRGVGAISQELSAGMARARKDAERDAQKLGESIRKGVKGGADGAVAEYGRMKASARQTYTELEKLALKVGRDQEREATRTARSAAREQIKEANRAATETAKAKREEARLRAREEAQIVADTRRQLREQSKYRQEESRKAAREEERGRRDADRTRRREEAQIIADTRRQLREQSRFRQEEARKAAREETRIARETERQMRANERVKVRDIRRSDRDSDRAQSTRGREVREFASSAMGTFKGIAGKGLDVGKEILSGTGVNFDISSAVNKGIKLESLAVAISNAGSKLVEKVDPATGQKRTEVQRESVGGLQSFARDIGQKYAFDPQQVLEGLSKYQAKTGDLATAKAGIDELAMLAKATSTDLQDMVDAAGDVGTAIGEVGEKFKTPQEKAAAVQKIMRVIAAQGAVGAVEIKDLSVQMAKLAAASQAFEGDADKNLEFMGSLAQLSRQKGGSASATQAATSVASFVSMLKTPARMKEFEKATGEKVYDEKSGFLRDPKWIIEKALVATMGDPEKLKKVFANVQGARAVEGSATTFREGLVEGRAKGITDESKLAEFAANKVREEFAKFDKGASEQKLQDDLKTAMDSKESRAQLFQNQLEKVVSSMADKVLPQMEKLGPKVIEVVEALSKLVSWAAENPGKAITMAIVGSIGKAAIGSMVAKSLENLIGGLAGVGGKGVGALAGGGAGGALGTAGAVLGAGALGVGLGMAITSGIEWGEKEATEGGNQAAHRDARVFGAMGAANKAAMGGTDDEITSALAAAERVRAELKKDIENAQDPTSYAGAIFGGKTIEEAGKEQADSQHIPELKAMLERLNTSIDGLTKKRLKVDADITSMPMSGINESGRSGMSGG